MNELLEKCLMRQDGLKLEGATLPESLSQLCLDATVSCIESFENRHNRRDCISAIEAYRQQGFNLQVLTLSWKELQIAQTALKPDGGNVLSSLDRKKFELSNEPSIVAIHQGEHVSKEQLNMLLELAHECPHPVKILVFLSTPRDYSAMPPAQEFDQVLASQVAFFEADRLLQDTNLVSTQTRPTRRI